MSLVAKNTKLFLVKVWFVGPAENLQKTFGKALSSGMFIAFFKRRIDYEPESSANLIFFHLFFNFEISLWSLLYAFMLLICK